MKRKQLLIIANVLAAACCLWAWQMWSTANAQKESSFGRLKECEQLLQKIQTFDRVLVDTLVVSGSDFDPSRVVEKHWNQSGLPGDVFTVSQYRARTDRETNLKLWGIRLPPADGNLRQATKFIAGLADSDAGIQVGRLGLSRARKADDSNSRSDEIWQMVFDEVTYLKESDSKEKESKK